MNEILPALTGVFVVFLVKSGRNLAITKKLQNFWRRKISISATRNREREREREREVTGRVGGGEVLTQKDINSHIAMAVLCKLEKILKTF